MLIFYETFLMKISKIINFDVFAKWMFHATLVEFTFEISIRYKLCINLMYVHINNLFDIFLSDLGSLVSTTAWEGAQEARLYGRFLQLSEIWTTSQYCTPISNSVSTSRRATLFSRSILQGTMVFGKWNPKFYEDI